MKSIFVLLLLVLLAQTSVVNADDGDVSEAEFDELLGDLDELTEGEPDESTDEEPKERQAVTSKPPPCRNAKFCATKCFKPAAEGVSVGDSIKASAKCFSTCCKDSDTPAPEDEEAKSGEADLSEIKSADEEELDAFLDEL